MFQTLKNKYSARRVRQLRQYIERNRCSKRPGLTHEWERGIGMDPTSFGGVIEWWECTKCGKNDFGG